MIVSPAGSSKRNKGTDENFEVQFEQQLVRFKKDYAESFIDYTYAITEQNRATPSHVRTVLAGALGSDANDYYTEIVIYSEHPDIPGGHATILAHRCVATCLESNIRQGVSLCLTELGYPLLRQDSDPLSITPEIERLIEKVIDDKLKGKIKALHTAIQQAADSTVRYELVKYDQPKGFWQLLFERLFPHSKTKQAAASDGKLKLTYEEWQAIAKELDPATMAGQIAKEKYQCSGEDLKSLEVQA